MITCSCQAASKVAGATEQFCCQVPHCHLPCPCLQVLDEIVQLLTEPRYQGKMVVVLAGYEAQVGMHGCLLTPLLFSSAE